MSHRHHAIDYVEFPMSDKAGTMEFYSSVFGWSFTEWAEQYVSFAGAGLEGGFDGHPGKTPTPAGPLIVIYSSRLAETKARVEHAGGRITKDVFAFPGGSRFHFLDPNGNELAVWNESETVAAK